MAASLADPQASPFAQETGTRSGAVNAKSSRPSFNTDQEGENKLVGHLSAVLDQQFRKLEDRTLNPLRSVVNRLEERCGRIEAMLQDRTETTTATVDWRQNGKKQPAPLIVQATGPTSRRSTACAMASTARQGEKLTRREKKEVAELLARIDQIAPPAADFDAARPSHPFKIDPSPPHGTLSRHQTADSERASSWSGESSPDADSESGDHVDYKTGAKYDPRDMPEDTEDDSKRGQRLVMKKVDVDKDPAAIRELKPRPCHQFYLAKSGCTHPDCHHGHHYRLSKEHLRYMKQLIQKLPCKKAVTNGVPCPEGGECIYPHKCPGGWNCVFGKTCRFSGIEGAHPYPGDFHTKQNYYDWKKGAKGDDAGAGWFSEVKESSGANEASSEW